MVSVGVDLGGSVTSTLVLDAGDRVVGRSRLKTPTTGDRGGLLEVIETGILTALDDADAGRDEIEAVGVGCPGLVIDGTVGGAANLPGFLERFALGDLLQQKLEHPVRVVNDVTAAAVAEHRHGAGRGTQDLLAVFVGTGVGGGIVLGGRAFEGGAGGAGELGHIVVRQGGSVCPCGRRGCVEAYAGRRAMVLRAERDVAAGHQTILFDIAKPSSQVSSDAFQEALDRGDPLVADLLDDAVAALGAGIASAVNLLDVEIVVLGGELADRLGEPFRLRVDAAARPHLFLQPPRVQIVCAELGDQGGALGAALVARDD